MKLYLIYIKVPEKEFNRRFKFIISNAHSYNYKHHTKILKGLYAFTDDEDKLNKFLKQRSKYIFKVKEKEFKSEMELRKFTWDNDELRLIYKNFDDLDDGGGNVSVLTKNEVSQVIDNLYENMFEFVVKEGVFSFDYEIFNDKIIDALDILGYTYIYDKFICSDEDRIDEMGFNESYSLTRFGRKFSSIVNFKSEFDFFKYLFRYTFFGI